MKSAIDPTENIRPEPGRIVLLPPEPTDNWRGAYRNTLLACLVLIVALIGAQHHADLVARNTATRAEFLRALNDKCRPLHNGESSVVINTNGKLRCRTYTNTGYGMAPRLVSELVIDVPPL